MPETEFLIRFRYVSPHDYFTPIIYIPVEETIQYGSSKNNAWKKFLNRFEKWQIQYIRQESIEKVNV